MYILSVVRPRIEPAVAPLCSPLKNHAHMACTNTPKTHALILVLDHQDPFQPFHDDTFKYHYVWLYKLLPQHHLIQHLDYNMNTTDY